MVKYFSPEHKRRAIERLLGFEEQPALDLLLVLAEQ